MEATSAVWNELEGYWRPCQEFPPKRIAFRMTEGSGGVPMRAKRSTIDGPVRCVTHHPGADFGAVAAELPRWS
jgi:hypothetical protein